MQDSIKMGFKEKLEPHIKIEEYLMAGQAKDLLVSEEKPYHCEFCDHKCKNKHALRAHVRRTHEGKTAPYIKCSLCEQSFQYRASLNVHIQTVHEKKKLFACELCSQKFGRRGTLNLHIRNVHQKLYCKKSSDKIYTCTCGKKMITEQGLKLHVKNSCGKGKNILCPVCKEVFESFSSRMKHFAVAHPQRTIYDCSFCNSKYLEKSQLRQHLKNRHEKEHGPEIYSSLPAPKGGNKKCPVCKEIFKSRSDTMKHYTLMHPDASIYNCSVCDDKFVTLNGLKWHNFNAHERKVSDLGCIFCGKEFAEKEELKNHILTTHKDKKYECSECEASYLSQVTLQSHIEQVHEGKKHQCSLCGEVFISMARLETHTALQHDRSKIFECPTCNVIYTKKQKLDKHIAFVHEKSSGHLCPECGENFRTRQQMKDHVLVVHEGKGFKCQFCSNIFKSKSSKNLHVRKVHEGFKPEPQKCSQCEKIYSSASALKLHVRAVHEKKRPYACHLCDLSFGQSGNLKIHLKGKHKEFSFTGGVKNGSFLPE